MLDENLFSSDKSIQHLFSSSSPEISLTQVCPSQLWYIDNYFTPEECAQVIEYTESLGYKDAPVTTYSGPVMMKDYRNNTRVMIDDLPTAQLLWQRIQDFVPLAVDGMVAIGLNERIRYFKNVPGNFFEWHYDGCFSRNLNEYSTVTLLVNLNEGHKGGETLFDDKRLPNNSWGNAGTTGRAILFKHRGWYHKGDLVSEGVKYMLRSDVMYRRLSIGEEQEALNRTCGLCNQNGRVVRTTQTLVNIACGC